MPTPEELAKMEPLIESDTLGREATPQEVLDAVKASLEAQNARMQPHDAVMQQRAELAARTKEQEQDAALVTLEQGITTQAQEIANLRTTIRTMIATSENLIDSMGVLRERIEVLEIANRPDAEGTPTDRIPEPPENT